MCINCKLLIDGLCVDRRIEELRKCPIRIAGKIVKSEGGKRL